MLLVSALLWLLLIKRIETVKKGVFLAWTANFGDPKKFLFDNMENLISVKCENLRSNLTSRY